MKDSFSENRGPSGWNAINRVMAEAIKHLPESPEDPLGPLNLRWSLAVGEEMAARSRVVGRTAKTLVVEVAGNEWIPVFKSYDKKIREKLNKMFDIKGVTSIKYKLAAKIPQPIPQTVKIQTANTYDRPMNVNYDPEEASLTSIQDSQLRDSLVRLSGKFRFISVVLAGLLFLANCAASTPQGTLQQGRAVESKAPPPPNSPYAVRQVYKLQKRHPEKNYRDPRAYYHFLKAFKYERDGDFDNASRHYALVVQYDPARESMHTHLVGLYLRTGQFNLALEAGENTLRRFPNNVRVRMIMGDILSSQGKYEEALNHYNKIMKLEPFNFRAFLLAGYNLKLMKQYDEAHDLFRKATVVDPSNPLGYHYLGSSLARSGEMENAEEKFRKSLTLRPSFIEARENLARVLEIQKKYEEAVEQYKIILKLKPGDKEIREHLKRIDTVSAEEVTSPGAKAFSPFKPEDTNIHTQLGTIFYEQAVYLEAVDEFRLALANQEDKELHLVIARIYELLGRMDKAIHEVEIFRRKDGGEESVGILMNLARLYGLNKEMRKSIVLLEKAVTMDPQNDRLYHALALAYRSLDENEKAIVHINKAIKLNDKKDTYYFEQGALFERMGQFDKAIDSMRMTLKINPHHSNAHNFIGYIYATQGIELDKAQGHLEQALNIQPRNGYFLDSLGWIYHKKGEPEKALTHIKKAMVYAQPDPVLYDHLGDVYFSMKNVTEARKAWKTSLSLTIQRLKEPAGEIPDPEKLREKIRQADEMMLNSF